MKIVAVDPGSKASGVAIVYLNNANYEKDFWLAKQFTDPLNAWAYIEEEFDDTDDITFIIEMYRTASHLTREAKDTIGLVRFFDLAAQRYHSYNVNVVLKVEQHRLSGRREAAELMEGTIEGLESDKDRKDAFSALAHCVVYRRSL